MLSDHDNTRLARWIETGKGRNRKYTKEALRKFIGFMCKECIYDPTEPGNWLDQVEACECTGCPLYRVRPAQGAGIELPAQQTAKAA